MSDKATWREVREVFVNNGLSMMAGLIGGKPTILGEALLYMVFSRRKDVDITDSTSVWLAVVLHSEYIEAFTVIEHDLRKSFKGHLRLRNRRRRKWFGYLTLSVMRSFMRKNANGVGKGIIHRLSGLLIAFTFFSFIIVLIINSNLVSPDIRAFLISKSGGILSYFLVNY